MCTKECAQGTAAGRVAAKPYGLRKAARTHARAFFYSAEFVGLHPELDESRRGTAAYNREFVRQGYYAYLRRTCDPEVCDAAGFDFWVSKLNTRLPSTDADYNEMIRAFLVSAEYRARFGLQ